MNSSRFRKAANIHRIALAAVAGAAFAAFPAQALDLGIYGVGHLSADSVDDGVNSGLSVPSNSSRLGFRGEHDLGGGVTALFQLEAGVDLTGQGGNDGNGAPTASTSDIFTAARDSYAGISGGYGTLLAGKVGGLNQWLYDYNLFADQVGDLGNIWGGSGLPGRVTDALHYRAPDLGAVSLALTYVPEEKHKAGMDVSIVKADYVAGPIKVGAAYASLGNDHGALALTASYDLGQFTAGGGMQNETDIGGTSGNDRTSITLGGSMKTGANGILKAQFTNSSADVNNADATQLAIGYDHALNKSTTAYVAYATTDNDANASFTANNWGHGDAVTPVAGNQVNALSIGLVIKLDAALASR